MKRFLSILAAVCIIATLMLSLSSCDGFDFNSIFNPDASVDTPGVEDNGHTHTFERRWSSDATHHWHEATCEDYDSCATAKGDYAEHKFKYNQCTICYAARECNHVYDDICDNDCNICGSKREPEHIYTNSCDNICDNCFAERNASHTPEKDDGDCTTEVKCTVCGDVIVAANENHIFTTSCDTTCNVESCKHIRTTSHTYSGNCDAECNGCGFIRTAPHSYGEDNVCDDCNYGSKDNPKDLDIPGTLTFNYAPNANADPVWYKFTTTSTVKISVTLSENTVMGYGTSKDNLTTLSTSASPSEITLTSNKVYYITFITSDASSGEVSATVKCYNPNTDTEWALYGQEILNFGDSIFGNNNSSTSVSSYLQLYSGATTYNCAFGGTRAHPRKENPGHINEPYRHFDMKNLINAIIAQDFTNQDAALTPNDSGDYFNNRFPEMLETIKRTTFTNQIITINHGTNDWTGGTSIANYKATLKYIIEQFTENYTNVRIVLISPTWRCTFDENGQYVPGGNDTLAHANGTNYDFAVAMKEVAEEMGVDFIDCYNIGIGPDNCLDYFNGSDGTHHDARGREYLAKHIVTELGKIIN